MIKKRALRERVYQSLDAMDVPASSGNSETKAWSDALREAIDHSFSPREASLINETLMGKTPAEIALHWGVAPKTVSNEKARVLQKLREVLLAQNSTDDQIAAGDTIAFLPSAGQFGPTLSQEVTKFRTESYLTVSYCLMI